MSTTLTPLKWYLHRLRAMDTAEIFARAREKLRHTTERLAAGTWRDFLPGEASGNVPALPAQADAPRALKEALAGDAVNILAGRWTLFGWRELQVTSPPKWHRDHARGIEVPIDGNKVDHRALPNGADARTIWEINRWAEMTRLAMHGWLNDDIPAVLRAQAWLADWMAANPVGRGINWASTLEAGLRLINFCWFDALVARMANAPPQVRRQQGDLAKSIVPAHVWWVSRYLSFGSSANNHRLGELTGLLLAARRWPKLENISGKADELWSQIAGCILEQFAEDGGNREQALHYHLFAFEMAWHACRAMSANDGPVVERLRRAAHFFARLSHPAEPWDHGDSDDAQIVPLPMKREQAAAEWRAWTSGAKSDLSGALDFWLGVPDSGATCDGTPPPEGGTTNGGWWIARESGMAAIEHEGWKVRVDASPLGFGKLAAHGHCDALHVSIWDGAHALVIDPGTGGYYNSPRLREELASWNAHNGPQPVGGFKLPQRIGTFLWAGQHEKPALDFKDEHLIAGFTHEGMSFTRRIRVSSDAIMIEDVSDYQGPLKTHWRFSPACRIEGFDEGKGRITLAVGSRRWIVSVPSAIARISAEPRKASGAFGQIESCPAIEVRDLSPVRMVLCRA